MVNTNRVAIVLGAPYPSPKAYAITTRETCRSLIQLGLKVKVYGSKSNYSDEDFEEHADINDNLKQPLLAILLVRIGKLGKSKINFVSWRLGLLLNLLATSKKIFSYNPNIIWVRDPMIAYFYSLCDKDLTIFFEIHDESGEYFLKKLIKSKKKIKYLPINKPNLEFILNLDANVDYCIAPMGIRKMYW